MPWKETCAVKERLKFVLAFEQEEYSLKELCRLFGISRPTAYKWLARYDAAGIEGLRDRSRAPHHHPNATDDGVVARIVALRRQRPTWGPKKLRAWLVRHEPDTSWPAASTIGVLVREHGLSHPRSRSRRAVPSSRPLAHCHRANSVWAADFKGWFRTGNGRRCEPLTISDGFSRYLLRCNGLERTTLANVEPLFEATFREYGLPHAIRTDNGPPFAAPSLTGLSRLSVWWIKLGITPERIRPGHPEENGRHERLHLTLKQETATPPAHDLRSQQRRFNHFRHVYNQERPHEALNQTTPAEHYQPSARAYPRRVPSIEYDTTEEVCRVYDQGCFYWRGRLLFLSETLQNEYIALQPTHHERYYAIRFAWMTIAYIDLRTMKLKAKMPKRTHQVDKQSAESVNHVTG